MRRLTRVCDTCIRGVRALKFLASASRRNADLSTNRMGSRCTWIFICPVLINNVWATQNAETSVEVLIDRLKDEDEEVRVSAVNALISLGPGAEAAIPALIERVYDVGEGRVWSLARIALWRIGQPSVSPLLEALFREDDEVRMKIGVALGRMGDDATIVVPSLEQALSHPNKHIQIAAACALCGLASEEYVSILLEFLKDHDPVIRAQAVIAMRTLRLAAKDSVPALIAAMGDKDEDVRCEAAFALGRFASFTEEIKAAIPVLGEAIKNSDSGVT